MIPSAAPSTSNYARDTIESQMHIFFRESHDSFQGVWHLIEGTSFINPMNEHSGLIATPACSMQSAQEERGTQVASSGLQNVHSVLQGKNVRSEWS